MSKITGKVPRGFTRYYVLYLLSEKPMTGKELIDEAERRSDGSWSPSPGLIYPLLGRLLDDELITELDGGRFTITLKGEDALKDYADFRDQLERQIELIRRMGVSMFAAGKFLAEEAVDRIVSVTESMRDRAATGSIELEKRFNSRYRDFLRNELKRLEGSDNSEESNAKKPEYP